MGRFRWMLLLAALLLPVAVVAGQQQVTLAAEEFSVVKGSTMWELAGEKCGDSKRWAEIFEINVLAGRLPDERLTYNPSGEPIVLLYPGERILIPTAGCGRVSALVELVPAAVNQDSALIAELAALRATVANQPSLHWLWFLALLAVLVLIAAAVWYGLRRVAQQLQLNGAARAPDSLHDVEASVMTPQAGLITPPANDTDRKMRLITLEVGEGRTEVRVGDVTLPVVGHEATVTVRGDVTCVARDRDDAFIRVDPHGRIRAVAKEKPPLLIVQVGGDRRPSEKEAGGRGEGGHKEQATAMAGPGPNGSGLGASPDRVRRSVEEGMWP